MGKTRKLIVTLGALVLGVIIIGLIGHVSNFEFVGMLNDVSIQNLLSRDTGGDGGLGFFKLLVRDTGGNGGLGFFKLLVRDTGGNGGLGFFKL